MTTTVPTFDQLRSIAGDLRLDLSDDDLASFQAQMVGSVTDFAAVDRHPDYLPVVKFPRTPGHRPDTSQNPFNAWYIKTEITGAPKGRLAGKTVAVKDNIAVAGVPMMNGSSIMDGYTPNVDATVVTRLLDAGAKILGKSQCEYYCFSGGSHTSAQGPVQNPHKAGYSAGGSSSGSAALVANGDVDLALGGDQGGSIRTPSAYCGIVGLKPTWGLVPYTGAMPIELTLDHLGPMTRSVTDNALALEVLAGCDGLDPRQTALAQSKQYTDALDGNISSLRIGVVREGFGHRKPFEENIGTATSEEDVDLCVRKAAAVFQSLGAVVEEVSIPEHLFGPTLWTVIATEGATRQMMLDNGHGFNWKGLYVTSMIDCHSAWRLRANELPDTVKYTMLLGQHMITAGRGRYYAKAQNLARKLKDDYDRALNTYDILLMPTTPIKAPPLPAPNASRQLYLQRAWENMGNTFSFDVTGHPALQIPCGSSDGLPIGLMLVGRHFDEMTLYRAAHVFEKSGDWRDRHP